MYRYERKISPIFSILALLVLTLPAVRAQNEAVAAGMRGLNNEVLQLHGAIQRATAGQVAELRREAVAAIANRAAAMNDLIEKDPSEALSLAFAPELTADLAARFPEAAGSLETHGTWVGTAETWILDYPDGSHRSVAHMKTGQEDLEVYFAGPDPEDLGKGGTLQVTGVRLGNKVAASSSMIEPLGAVAANTASTASSCSTTGPQNTVILLVTFPGVVPPASTTVQSVHDTFFGTSGYSLDGYWREASYGQTSATGDVFGWYTLSTPYTCGTTDAMRAEAINLAAKAGVNFQNYTRLFMIVPDMGCGWDGAATMVCTTLNTPTYSFSASTSYITSDEWGTNAETPAIIAIHEGGHNLGLNHSRSRAFGTEALGPMGTAGTLHEYGDGFTAMSNGGPGHYDAPHKAEFLNWLTPGNYQVVQGSGTWTIAPLETPSTGLQALKIQRGTGNNAWLWVEYRQPTGIYDSAYATGNVWSNEVFSGAVIHYEDSFTTNGYSDLLDFTPTSPYAFYDPALVAGQTWSDPYSNVSISVQSATASGLTVNVSYGSTPCTHANPTLSISPANPSVTAGSSVNYTLSLTNNDSSACSASTFFMSSTQPSGWIGTLSTTSLAANPGQTVTAVLTETVPASAAPATYPLSATAANGAYTASASANCTVTAPVVPSLTDTLSAGSLTYTSKQSASMTSVVKSGGSAASGASVKFTMTKPNRTTVTGTASTGSSGTATWSYRFGPKDPAGTYSVVSTATYQSQTATSNAVTFTLR